MSPDATGTKAIGDRVALALASGLGVGFVPVVPGTFGSLPGLLLTWLLWRAAGPWAVVAGLLVVVPVGLWAADRAAQSLGHSDPRAVVVDEIAGQMTTLLFLPPTASALLAGFLVFRVMDVVKPFPARRLEALPGGSGIMADDLVAGLYANAVLQAAAAFSPSVAAWLGSP